MSSIAIVGILWLVLIIILAIALTALHTAALVGVRAGLLPSQFELTPDGDGFTAESQTFLHWLRWIRGVARGDLWIPRR